LPQSPQDELQFKKKGGEKKKGGGGFRHPWKAKRTGGGKAGKNKICPVSWKGGYAVNPGKRLGRSKNVGQGVATEKSTTHWKTLNREETTVGGVPSNEKGCNISKKNRGGPRKKPEKITTKDHAIQKIPEGTLSKRWHPEKDARPAGGVRKRGRVSTHDQRAKPLEFQNAGSVARQKLGWGGEEPKKKKKKKKCDET